VYKRQEIKDITLNSKRANDNVTLTSGSTYKALVTASDHEKDSLTYRWEVKPESDSNNKGGDFEEDIGNLDGSIANQIHGAVDVIAPKEPGAYRLFVYVNDGNDHVGHANIPFKVVAE